MRASGLHHVREAVLGAPQGPGQVLERRDEVADDPRRRRDPDGRRERVVGGLAGVHVVVGVHRCAGAHRGEGGQDLVDVHVRRGARTGLEHVDGELVVVEAGEHLVGRRDDGFPDDPVQVALLDVDQGRGALDLHQCADQSGRHPPARDGEVVDGPLGLGLPPRLDRYRHGPQRVVLDAESGRLEGRWVGRAHEVRSTPDGLGSGQRVKRVRATAVSG
ncbi:MAG: hypothetical protein V9E94_05480 [Microthrixaceae bacterium]